MSEAERIGGDLVIETLAALGVRRVYGIPGQHALGLFHALGRSELELVATRVENNAAFAADGHARATGEVGVLLLSTGPGALTSLGAVQEAWASAVPLLVISSQVPTRGLGGTRNGLLHQLDDQQTSARNVTKSQRLVRTAAEIPSAIEEAWELALSTPAGPTWLEIPEDVLLTATDLPEVRTVDAAPRRRSPRPEFAQAAAELLAAAERPMILAGGGVRRSVGADEELVRVAEVLDAPVVSTAAGKGALAEGHRLHAGSWVEDQHTTHLLDEADVLLIVGTAVGEVNSNYGTMAPRGQVIQIDAEARVLGSNYPGLGIHADAALALADLADRVSRVQDAGTPVERRDGAVVSAELLTQVAERLDAQDLAPERALIADLRAAVPEGTDTFWDMTIAGYWAWSAWPAHGHDFHSAQGSGGLGYAFPAALGAASGTGRRTLAVSGDGGAMYSLSELATARQHDLDVTWLLIDDGGYGILREYNTGAFGTSTATELVRPDFAAVARSFKVPVTEATPETVGEAIAATFESTGPALVVLPALLRMFAPTHL